MLKIIFIDITYIFTLVINNMNDTKPIITIIMIIKTLRQSAKSISILALCLNNNLTGIINSTFRSSLSSQTQ